MRKALEIVNTKVKEGDMKLVYATNSVNGIVDSEIIKDFDLDLAYGEDENNFVLTLPLEGRILDANGYLYIIEEESGQEEGTEYGGIIDAVEVNTGKNEVTYSGRTWSGIFDSIMIYPDDDGDGKDVSGNAHDIIRDLISPYDFSGSVITVSTDASPIVVPSYELPKYQSVYKGLNDMLFVYGGKLIFKFDPDTRKVVVSAEWAVAFNQEDDFNSVEVSFRTQKITNAVNHYICTGKDKDDGTDYTIHLYTDEAGGVMPYATTDHPIQDSDYILTEANKQITGVREIVEVDNSGDISAVKNYKLLASQPVDWGDNFESYYEINSNGNFSKVKGTKEDSYEMLSTKPDDWDENYAKYYTIDHKTVQGVDTSTYTALTKRPRDWRYNYGNYYIRTWDGTQYVWQKVSSVTDVRYVYQTKKPTNWQTNYSSYYQRKVVKTNKTNAKKKTITEKATGDGYETVKKVKQGGNEVVPTWKKNTYFTRYTSNRAPKFGNNVTKYIINKSEDPPAWVANTYYEKISVPIAPPFKDDFYYEQVLDHYAKMVESALDTLKEYAQFRDSIEIENLDLVGEFDIGDIIAVSDQKSGIEVWQPITKKIVTINRKGKNIDYEVGKSSN